MYPLYLDHSLNVNWLKNGDFGRLVSDMDWQKAFDKSLIYTLVLSDNFFDKLLFTFLN